MLWTLFWCVRRRQPTWQSTESIQPFSRATCNSCEIAAPHFVRFAMTVRVSLQGGEQKMYFSTTPSWRGKWMIVSPHLWERPIFLCEALEKWVRGLICSPDNVFCANFISSPGFLSIKRLRKSASPAREAKILIYSTKPQQERWHFWCMQQLLLKGITTTSV